ncbi:MAG: DUF2141 domain-containing protein [Bacillota bacterium]
MKVIDIIKKILNKNNIKSSPYLLLLPAVIFILFLQILPLIQAIYMSFLNVKPNTLRVFYTTLRAPFVGFNNYMYVISGSNGNFKDALNVSITKTISFVIVVNILTLAAALIIALALNRKFKFNRISRCLLLLPFIMPGFVIETAWLTFLDRNDGYVNKILVDWLKLVPNRIEWFSGEQAFWVVVLITVWHYFPLFAIFLLAGLQNISREYYEAAEIDGAGHIKRFVYITLPLLRPIIAILVFLGTILNIYYSYRVLGTEFYEEAQWRFITDYLFFNYFGFSMHGYGTAGALMLMICVILLILVWYAFFKRDFNSNSDESSFKTDSKTAKVFNLIHSLIGRTSNSFLEGVSAVNRKTGIASKTGGIFRVLKLTYKRLPRIDYISVIFWPVVLFVGFIHLTSGIGREAFWYDESYSAAIIKHSFVDILGITGGDSHPPLYFIMLKVFSGVFGNSEASLRLLSVFGVLALAALGMGPVRRAFDKFTGMIFALIVLIIPMSLSMAQETRMYTWTAFFVTRTVLYGYLCADKGRISDFIKLGLFSVASAYIHYYALLAVTIANIILLIYLVKLFDKKRLYAYLVTAGAAVACYGPWIITLASQISKTSKNFWILSVNNYVIWSTLLFPFTAKFQSRYPFVVPSLIGALIFIVTGLMYAIRKREKKGLLAAYGITVYLLTLITAVVISYLVRPIFIERYIFPVVGLFLLAFAYGISKLKYKDFSIFAVVLLLVFSLVPYMDMNKERYNGPMKEICRYMEENIKSDDIFIHADEHTFGLFSLYFPNHRHFFYMDKDFKGYSGYRAFEPAGITGSDISSFIKGRENMWLVGRQGGTGWQGIYSCFNSGLLSYKDKSKVFQTDASPWFRFLVRRVYHGDEESRELCSNGKITIKLGGLQNRPGPLVAKVFNKDVPIVNEGYTELIEENVFMTESVELVNGDAEIILEGLPMGEYCVVVFHDENNNGKIDVDKYKNPKEGTGISGNFILEKPRFEINKFPLDYYETETLISISYPDRR